MIFFKVKTRNLVFSFIFLSLLIVSDLLLFSRYSNWGIKTDSIWLFIAIIDVVLLFMLISFFRFKRIVNPSSVYLVFVGLFAYSVLPLSENIHFSNELLLIILCGVAAYFVGVFCLPQIHIITFPVFTNRTKRIFYYILCVLTFSCFIYEIKNVGYIPIFVIGQSLDIYGEVGESNSVLHTFVLLTPILFYWSLILAKEGIIQTRIRNCIVSFLLFVFVNNFGRTSLLMFIITGLIYLEFYTKLSAPKFISIIFLFISLFIIMGNVRSGSTFDGINKVLRRIGNTQYETSILESYLISYSSVNFYKMNDVIQQKEVLNYSSNGRNSLKPIVKLLNISEPLDNVAEFQTQQNLSTYIADPYLDFGYAGVVVLNCLYGMIAVMLFERYEKKNCPEYIISWGVVVFCILMGCFFNAFNTMLVWVIYICNKILLKR